GPVSPEAREGQGRSTNRLWSRLSPPSASFFSRLLYLVIFPKTGYRQGMVLRPSFSGKNYGLHTIACQGMVLRPSFLGKNYGLHAIACQGASQRPGLSCFFWAASRIQK